MPWFYHGVAEPSYLLVMVIRCINIGIYSQVEKLCYVFLTGFLTMELDEDLRSYLPNFILLISPIHV